MFSLAKLYEDGRGVTRDVARARDYYARAAEAGLAEAREALWRLSGERQTAPASIPPV
jgi:localization factor PodJL